MYKYKTKPYEHQEKIFADSWCRKYFGLFMEMGTGKSKVAIDTMGRLFLEDRIKTCLILAPKGVFDNWVFNEIPRHLPSDIKVNVVRWQNYHTQTYTRQLEELIFPDLQKENTLQVFVMNVEALSTIRAMGHAKLFLNKNPDSLMIVDESTTIKNRSAKRTKNIIELGRLASYRRILTGSPITKSPMDLFSQCMFLSPNALGFKSYYAFQGRYAVVVNKTMGHRSFRDIVGY
jgi:SNF2 family DNA or RNA helicase